MGKKIMIDPAKVKTTAKKIEAEANEYKSLFTQMFSEVEALSSAWQGADNIAYTSKITSYKGDFEKMKLLMDRYAEHLTKSAANFERVQSEIRSKASML